jgi:hypothetical protein
LYVTQLGAINAQNKAEVKKILDLELRITNLFKKGVWIPAYCMQGFGKSEKSAL